MTAQSWKWAAQKYIARGKMLTIKGFLDSGTSSTPSVRGGYQVSYCSSDENEISESTKRISISSQCVKYGSADEVFFDFSLSQDTMSAEYTVSVLISGSEPIQRFGEFENCK